MPFAGLINVGRMSAAGAAAAALPLACGEVAPQQFELLVLQTQFMARFWPFTTSLPLPVAAAAAAAT